MRTTGKTGATGATRMKAKKRSMGNAKERMQAIKGVSMFYARSSRINSSIIQVEWICFALILCVFRSRCHYVCVRVCVSLCLCSSGKMWFRFGLNLRQYRLSYRFSCCSAPSDGFSLARFSSRPCLRVWVCFFLLLHCSRKFRFRFSLSLLPPLVVV